MKKNILLLASGKGMYLQTFSLIFTICMLSSSNGFSQNKIQYTTNLGLGGSFSNFNVTGGLENVDFDSKVSSYFSLGFHMKGYPEPGKHSFGISGIIQMQPYSFGYDIPITFTDNQESGVVENNRTAGYAVFALFAKFYPKFNFPTDIGIGYGSMLKIFSSSTVDNRNELRRPYAVDVDHGLVLKNSMASIMFEIGQNIYVAENFDIRLSGFYTHVLANANRIVRPTASEIYLSHYGLLLNFYVKLN